ncbi:Hypothetical predicted protein [Mytilus galloprovincialis]|uniref:Uncharacterized protein n=1 Tax=Mytilus galloprovincialis TaxID=29158 RepID=A0A8B6HDV5_MYTGA|nr:Hypothetical predicted protein [Mytilus galloprovincialis]VDI78525.1 Hypothetical predicted protein [Mytilus galloprovincialis]
MDKFGSSRRAPARSMLQDLDMKDYRITGLGEPKDDADAVTKEWVDDQLKRILKDLEALQSECNQLKMDLKRMTREINDSIKTSTRDKVDRTECVSTNGGKMSIDLDMQGHAIRNLPEGSRSDEPVTKGWYAKNWQELVASMQSRINDLEKKIKSSRSKRRVSEIDDHDRSIDSIKTTLEGWHASNRG